MRYASRASDINSLRGGLKHIHGIGTLELCAITLFIYLYVLSPYFDVGGLVIHGGMLAMLMFFGAHPVLPLKAIQQRAMVLTLIGFCLFAAYNLLVSIFYSHIFSTTYLTYTIQLVFYVLLGFSIGLYMNEKGMDLDQTLTLFFRLTVFVVFVNAVIVLLEYFFPPVRTFIESFLYLADDSNIDYLTREFRLRGIASGGAANLSLFHGATLVLLQALYIKKKVGFGFFAVATAIIFTSLLFIGRTGILVGLIGTLLFHALNLAFSKETLSLRRVLLYISLVLLVVMAPAVFSMLFPDSLLGYSLSFFYEGTQGLQEEGTVGSVLSMFQMSTEWQKLMFGIGTHSGGFEFGGRSDSGYMKMFTALGIPMAIMFYVFLLLLARHVLTMTHYKSLWIVFLAVMFIAEIKEPFIFKGYSARLLWLVIGIGLCYSLSSPFSDDSRTRR